MTIATKSAKPATGGDAAHAAGLRSRALMPVAYSLIVLIAILGAFAYYLRTQGVFACPAAAANADHFLAYCNAKGFGDYDRGAFKFGLEPRAVDHAARADVIFLGSSRMQFAFSAKATANWFAQAGARFYLLGFSHTENVIFAGPLLADLKPRARAYVINVDRFFDDRETPPTRHVLRDADARSRYTEKRFWQSVQRPLCTAVPAVCDTQIAYVRFHDTGAWERRGDATYNVTGVADGPASDRERWDRYAELARTFLARLPVDRSCVFLTIAPSEDTRIDEARALAAVIGRPLVTPQLDRLRTTDGSHLDAASAERFSAAFLAEAGPELAQCLRSTPAKPQ